MPEILIEFTNEKERTYITNDHWYCVQEPWWGATPPRMYEYGVKVTLHKVYKSMAEYVLTMV
ncbi:MAG: hypothetical protein JBO36_05030 [Candidatus Thiodiazotropha taylori]|nr:hypothetical protein [Candidatus Thiodiazotropha taylori]